MHTPSHKIEEDLGFPKVIAAKRVPGKVRKLIHGALFGHLKQLLPKLKNC
jgi:hypothetical protein